MCDDIIATFLIHSLRYIEERQTSTSSLLFTLLCCSIVAVDARRSYKRRRLTGRAKVDVKAQSHSKLYNRAESLLGSHTSETLNGEKQSRGKKRHAFTSVCAPHCTYNMLHMNCWWNGKMKHWQLGCRSFLRLLFKLLKMKSQTN